MEIHLLAPHTIKIRGKKTTTMVDPSSKTSDFQTALFLLLRSTDVNFSDGVLSVDGPGEYEVGGTKIWGLRHESSIVYGIKCDGLSLLIGTLSALEKAHAKLSESDVVIVCADTTADVSFLTGFSPKYVLLYGDKAKEVVGLFEKEGVTEAVKVSFTAEKLPEEMQTVLLT